MTEEEKTPYLIDHDDSLFDDQLRKLAGGTFWRVPYSNRIRIPQLVLVEAKKNQKLEPRIREIIRNGFTLNGTHYVRYGKSASQAKAGITLFVDDEVAQELLEISKLGIDPGQCVISKYEAQRCLILSACTLIHAPLPRIVIVDEYTKVLPEEYIRYVEEEKREFVDRETGQKKTYNARVVKEGLHDIKLSPFDGCGCHDVGISELWSNEIGLDYHAIGFQIRLPFFKGYSVEFPFKEYYRSLGIDSIKDVFGHEHKIDEIDCIWNTSMWKAYKMFKYRFGDDGWNEYIRRLDCYEFKLGISKYSHHKKDLNLKARLNFQYIQCLDLWNPKYTSWFDQKPRGKYDIMDENNWGNAVKLASYTTNLYENIIKGSKLHTLHFLGVDDTTANAPNSRYQEACLINDNMLKDPCIRRFIHRKLKHRIEQAKYGKIYASGFYHTVVGDMIGYLEYAAGIEPRGCLNAGEFFCDTLPQGDILSFRSPLVCPSEVNNVKIVANDVTKQWCAHFKDQDVVMINMHDLSMPRQGGMDADGDAVFLCNDPLLVKAKIDKPIIIDVDDKVAAKMKEYNSDAIVEYEMATRDSRIGEITNVGTCILNQYTDNSDRSEQNSNNISLLRILQGKEIDFLKTGVRWQMNRALRRQGDKLPYFLLHTYPKKMDKYLKTKKYNKNHAAEFHMDLNAYHSPSPMNEICDYIESWERKCIQWDKSFLNTHSLVTDSSYHLDDQKIRMEFRLILNRTSRKCSEILRDHAYDDREARENAIQSVCQSAMNDFHKFIDDDKAVANYAIDVAYSRPQESLQIVWQLFGDTIIENLMRNTPHKLSSMIIEVPYETSKSTEYLGKYYELIEGCF